MFTNHFPRLFTLSNYFVNIHLLIRLFHLSKVFSERTMAPIVIVINKSIDCMRQLWIFELGKEG